MRKQEYIHIHALLVEVTRYLIENEDETAKPLSTYEQLDTRPSSIYKSKQNHHEAIIALNDTIEPWLDQKHADNPVGSVNEPQ